MCKRYTSSVKMNTKVTAFIKKHCHVHAALYTYAKFSIKLTPLESKHIRANASVGIASNINAGLYQHMHALYQHMHAL